MFALGAGPVPGLLLPEIFPSRIRAKAMAVCMCVHWVIIFCLQLSKKKKKILLPTSDLHFTIPLVTELGMS